MLSLQLESQQMRMNRNSAKPLPMREYYSEEEQNLDKGGL